jgi:hypothetical protein
MKSKKRIRLSNEDEEMLPAWLRYAVIILAFAWLLSLAFRQGAPPRADFPPHVPRTVK